MMIVRILLALFWFSRVAQALEMADASHYRFDNWKVEQGLPQNSVQAIRQTRDGYLWVGTRFGLARFDGMNFSIFNIANTAELVSDNCMALAEDSDGSLWIGTDRGLLHFLHDRFTRYTSQEGLSDDL